jgi:hypothetical protein
MDAILNVRVKQGKLTYKDQGKAKSLFKIPPAARVLAIYTDITTAFDDTGTDLLNVGTAADASRFASAVDLSSKTWLQPTILNPGQQPDRPTEVLGTYTGQNTNATAGGVTVYMMYATVFD